MRKSRLMKVVGLLLGIGLVFGLTNISQAGKPNPSNENIVIILSEPQEVLDEVLDGDCPEVTKVSPCWAQLNKSTHFTTTIDTHGYTEIKLVSWTVDNGTVVGEPTKDGADVIFTKTGTQKHHIKIAGKRVENGIVYWDSVGVQDFAVAVLDLRRFLVRDGSNYWNLIEYRADGKYRDQKKEVTGKRAKLFIAVSTITDKVAVSLELKLKPTDFLPKMLCQASSPQVAPQTVKFDSSGLATAVISSAGKGEEGYELSLGYDCNGNGALDADESLGVSNRVRLFTKGIIETSWDSRYADAVLAELGHYNAAATLQYIFLGKPKEAPILSTVTDGTVHRTKLTHAVGAPFAKTAESAKVDQRNFVAETDLGKKIAQSQELRESVKGDLKKHRDNILKGFEGVDPPADLEFDFVHKTSGVGFKKKRLKKDLYYALKGANWSYKLKVFVHMGKHKRLTISKVEVSDGVVTDTYDFDYFGGGIRPREAARIQFGWRTPIKSNPAGHVFLISANFAGTLKKLPFPGGKK